ncbi:MAG: hypothetical protein LLF86_01135 [Nitrospiraceae bacterium]|nr:hypothetical protein [Nitrospiraceae bacterium]
MLRNLAFLLLCIVLVAPAAYAAQDSGKTAIASPGKTITDPVSTLAGRAPYFQIFDSTGKLIETIENPYKNSRGGAGIAVADFLAKKGVSKIAAGTFGPMMISAMESKKISYIEFKGSVEQALKYILDAKK